MMTSILPVISDQLMRVFGRLLSGFSDGGDWIRHPQPLLLLERAAGDRECERRLMR